MIFKYGICGVNSHLMILQRGESGDSPASSGDDALQKHSRRKTKILLFILILSTGLWSQESNFSFSNWVRSYPNYLITGLRHTLSDRNNQLILGTAAASIILLYPYDRSVQKYSQEKGLLRKDLAKLLDQYGGGWAYPLTLLGVGIASVWQKDNRMTTFRKFEYVITSFEVTVTITNLLKWSVGRERPNKQSTTSFPSGHTSGSFVVAATMNELYGRRIGIPAYIIAGLVGIERIHDNKHWLTDVLAGAALGTVVGRGFGIVFQDKLAQSGITLVPVIRGKNVHILISMCIN